MKRNSKRNLYIKSFAARMALVALLIAAAGVPTAWEMGFAPAFAAVLAAGAFVLAAGHALQRVHAYALASAAPVKMVRKKVAPALASGLRVAGTGTSPARRVA